jgi:hypothetical protein
MAIEKKMIKTTQVIIFNRISLCAAMKLAIENLKKKLGHIGKGSCSEGF